MTSARVHLTTPGRQLVACKEYAEIPVSPADLLGADGALRVAEGVLNRYVDVDFADGRLRVRARGVSGVFALTDEVSVQVLSLIHM